MFNFTWLRGIASSTNSSPMESWFDPGVVCPDGTVMWLWDGEEDAAHWADASKPRPHSPTSSSMVHNPEQIHYHYYRFGMGPWLFLGLQVSLAIALLLILSPEFQAPTTDTSVDSLAIPQPHYLIGFLY